MILNKINPYFTFEDISTQIKNINSHFEKFHELGNGYENGTIERVENATKKSIQIFEKTFNDNNEKITLVVYEFPEPNSFGASNSYFHSKLKSISEVQKILKKEFNIFIIKTQLKEIQYKDILNAIVNTEMGFEPALSQIVYFFSDSSENAFVMFDDRSCQTNGI